MKRYVIALGLLVLVSAVAVAGSITTRYGALTTGGQFHSILSFKGHRLIKGDNSLSAAGRFHRDATDIVLIQETGGTACPALYYFVNVSKAGAKATPAFGTCSEEIQVTRKKNSIFVSMPGFRGPFEPEKDKERAAKERHVFIYRGGLVTENGKRAK